MAKSIERVENQSIQRRLELELARLKRALEIDDGLRVVWMPTANGQLAGEMKGKIIYIYEVDDAKAVETLRHEVVDYLICQAIEPYKEMTNALIRMLNAEAYKKKEELVEKLSQLVND